MDARRGNVAWIVAIGAAVAGLAYFLSRRLIGSDGADHDEPRAPALKGGGAHGPIGTSGNVRPAGPGAMRDPPADWSKIDEALDETYPASDPPAVKHVD